MILFQQNEAVADRRDLFVMMVDSTDRVTPKTGLSLTVQLVKPGGNVYAASGATVTEVGAGTYRVRLASEDLDTLGMVMLKVSATGSVVEYIPGQIVRFLDEVHMAKAALVNARTHEIETGVDQIIDDDGSTVLCALTPSESDGVITVSPS